MFGYKKKYHAAINNLTALTARHSNLLAKYKVLSETGERHAEWVTKTRTYGSYPDDIYIWNECSECGKSINTHRFSVEMWEEYMKYHYFPNLPTYCACCGCKMDLGEDNERTEE